MSTLQSRWGKGPTFQTHCGGIPALWTRWGIILHLSLSQVGVGPLPRLWETLQFGQMASPFVNKEMVLFISESLSGLFLPCLKNSAFSQVNTSRVLSYKSLKPEFFFLPSHLLPFLSKGQFSCWGGWFNLWCTDILILFIKVRVDHPCCPYFSERG